MGRGAANETNVAVGTRSEKKGETIADQAMDMEQIFASIDFVAAGPDWRVPNEFYLEEARQFIRPGTPGGIELDQAIALRLLKLDYEGDFNQYRRWYNGSRSLIQPPAKTCPGMMDAGSLLADTIDRGEKIAVFCDYDVDGTTAGETFRRGLAPYGAKLHYGWADAQQGFGLTNEFVEQAAKEGCKVLVTLDCGSGQADQVALAQKLGMKVIVVDHHHVAENPAEFHLNPNLSNPPTSHNTGAQLAWKLAAAVQIAEEGNTREEHWETPVQLAGMGCLADMGSVVLPENRAFFWSAHEHPPAGVRALAAALEEDPELPGGMISTQACMNLPKRTSKVSAKDIGALLACETEEEAAPLVEKLVAAYEEAKPVKEEMQKRAIAEIGEADWSGDEVKRPQPDKFFAAVTFDEYPEYAGYTGPVATKLSRTAAKPAVVFCYKGTDEHGQELYKFSTRDESGTSSHVHIGELIENEAMQKACTIKKADESGQVVERPVVGGHQDVISGTCTKEQVETVISVMEEWAAEKGGKDGKKFWSRPWDGPEAFLSERRVSGARLTAIEEQAKRLGPFSKRQQLASRLVKGREPKMASNREPEISVVGSLTELEPDPENDRFLAGELILDNGARREIRFPKDIEERPVGKMCEWVLKISGRPNEPYYLRNFHDPSAVQSHNGNGSI